jgi:hypothetical protein
MLVVDPNPNFTTAATEAFNGVGIGSKIINSNHHGINFLVSRGNEVTMCAVGIDPESKESNSLKFRILNVCVALEIPYVVTEQFPQSKVRLSAFKFWDRGEMTSFFLTGEKSEINFWYKLWDLVIVGHGATHDSSRCIIKPRDVNPKNWDDAMCEKQKEAWSPFNIPQMLAWQKYREEFLKQYGAQINSSRIKKFF